MNRDSVKYKNLFLGLGVILICSLSACGRGAPSEAEKLRNNQFVFEDVFLSITNGSSFADVTRTLGSAVRHQFTVAENGDTWTLIRCFLHTGEEEGYNFYQLLFRDGALVRTIGYVKWGEMEEIPYEGTTRSRAKPWDIEDMTGVKKLIQAPAVTHEQIRAELKDARETMEKYKGHGNIPAVVWYFFAPAFRALAKKGYPVNEELRQRFDGCRASIGMTIKEVDALYGEPLHVLVTKTGGTARIYGDDRYLGNAVDSFLVFPYVAVLFDSEGHVASVYSDGFFCKDWYPNLPSWRRD